MIKPLIILILTFALHNIVQCQENKIIRLANRDIERIVSKEIILENQNCTFSFLEQNENSYTRIASECRIYPVDEGIVIFDWLSQKVHFYLLGKLLHQNYCLKYEN